MIIIIIAKEEKKEKKFLQKYRRVLYGIAPVKTDPAGLTN